MKSTYTQAHRVLDYKFLKIVLCPPAFPGGAAQFQLAELFAWLRTAHAVVFKLIFRLPSRHIVSRFRFHVDRKPVISMTLAAFTKHLDIRTEIRL